MKYRIVELADGRYQAQWRIFLFWWVDSSYSASLNLEDQLAFVRATGINRIVAVIYK